MSDDGISVRARAWWAPCGECEVAIARDGAKPHKNRGLARDGVIHALTDDEHETLCGRSLRGGNA